MCGIAGIVRGDGGRPDVAAVRAMTAALAHRGPDGEGVAALGVCALGHRRLAVIDLSPAAAQPMQDASGRYHVTYNGEIYNYVEVREELAARGVTFRSQSDTEVLLEGYALWGPRVLDRLNGMFAFAIWDSREESLFAARDRFGEKPFFFTVDADLEFRFASEVKALRAAGLTMAADRQTLFRFVAYGLTGTRDETFYAGLRQLPPAHCLHLRAGRLDVRPYWSSDTVPAGDSATRRGGDPERVEEIRALLEDAVRLRLRSDVTVGSCLSGGIDSSAIVALVTQELRTGHVGTATDRQQTFSASFPDSPSEEIAHARAVAAATGVRAHETVPTAEDCLAELPRVIAAQDEPFSGPSIFAEWKVMQLARDHGVTVLLNGQGADEVFAGYHFYFGDLWVGLLRSGRLRAVRRSMRSYDSEHGSGAARALLRGALRSRIPHVLRELRGGPRLPWLTREFVASIDTMPPPRPADLRESLAESRSLRMLPHLLRQADRSAMAFSREARLPFLDHRLVEVAAALPDDLLLRDGQTKWILRRAVRGLVPDTVLGRRDKVGFAVPTAAWMRGALSPAIHDTLGSQRFRERAIFAASWIVAALQAFDAGDDGLTGTIWNAWITELWLQTCVDA